MGALRSASGIVRKRSEQAPASTRTSVQPHFNMPKFVAQLTSDHPGPFSRVYHIEVDPPDDQPIFDERARAFITEELETTRIARELAEKYTTPRGQAPKEGDVIQVILRQVSSDRREVHKFPLPIVVRYSTPNRGTEYLQLGIADLYRYFDISEFQPDDSQSNFPSFLRFVRRDDIEEDCFAIPIE